MSFGIIVIINAVLAAVIVVAVVAVFVIVTHSTSAPQPSDQLN